MGKKKEPVLKGAEDFDDGLFVGVSVQVQEDPDVLIYQDSRFVKEASPTAVFIPSNELIFTMMRACIAVEKPEDLWINKKGF